MKDWNEFPHDNADFAYADQSLEQNWSVLHAGDHVPFPDNDWIQDCLERVPQAAPSDFDGDIAKLAQATQSAWRAFHVGNFQRATIMADQCGLLAHACANKASGIYATYLEADETLQQACFMSAIERAEQAVIVLPEDANSHYFHAFNLGRYSQSISIVEALRRGMGGKIHASLERTLKLLPQHAEAHTAMGMYHAEIINKVGKMIGGLTYGASTDTAISHFETAVELTPDSPIAHIEFGNGLYLLFADRKLDEVTELYIKASEMQPKDAMEKLDIEAALAELE